METWEISLLVAVAVASFVLGWLSKRRFTYTSTISFFSYNCATRMLTINVSNGHPAQICAYAYDATGGAVAIGTMPPAGSVAWPGQTGRITIGPIPYQNSASKKIVIAVWGVDFHFQEPVTCP